MSKRLSREVWSPPKNKAEQEIQKQNKKMHGSINREGITLNKQESKDRE